MSLLFEGRHIEFEPGETIAEALLRAGVTAFSRGPKYHRPRGPFCLSDTCAQCHMRVGGEPNVSTCTTPAADGLEVERQNVVGSGDLDLLRAVDFLYPEGLDHHHLMTRFKLLGSATQLVARRLAGVGKVPTADAVVPDVLARREQVVVVGAGRSGLAAAAELVRAGARPLVLEARPQVGGRAADGFGPNVSVVDVGELALGTRVLGMYPEGQGCQLIAKGPTALWQIVARRVIVATGGIERPLLFEGNDLPGVFAGRAFTRLRKPPGKRAVIVAAHADALRVAELIAAKGLEVAAILDGVGALSSKLFPVIAAQPIQVTGRSKVSALRYQRSDGVEAQLKCDVVLVVAPLAPAFELAAEAGVKAELGAAGFSLVVNESGATSVPWLHAAGSVTGHRASGASAGAAVAHCRLADRL